MSDLSRLLSRAFENKGNRNYYASGSYSVGFEERTWETLFEVCYNRIPVLQGNTFDKEVHLCTGEDAHLYNKLFSAVSEALPEYHFGGEVYEKYMQQLSFANYLEVVSNAEKAALHDGYDQFVYVDGEGNYAFARSGYDEPVVPLFDDEQLVGKVNHFWQNGIAKVSYEKFEQPCSLEEYLSKKAVKPTLTEQIASAASRTAERNSTSTEKFKDYEPEI